MTNNNDGFGAFVAPAKNVMLQTANAAKDMAEVTAKLEAEGWTQTAHDEWQAPVIDAWTAAPTKPHVEYTPPVTTTIVHKQELVSQDGWGAALTPAPAPGRDWTAPSARGQSAPSAAELPHAWAKPPEVQPRGSNWPCDTGQGTRYFTGYQNAANYVLLAGPYDTIEEAQQRYEVAFERMKNDTALQFAFGVFDFKNMTVLTMPFEKAMRKGAYGRL